MVSKKMRKIALWTLLVVMLAGLVWAGMNLMGQSNKSAADAGSSAADMEMASLDSIKQSTKSACDWNQERALRKKLTLPTPPTVQNSLVPNPKLNGLARYLNRPEVRVSLSPNNSKTPVRTTRLFGIRTMERLAPSSPARPVQAV